MTKKDINFIKHIKPIVKARAEQDKQNSRFVRSARIMSMVHQYPEPDDQKNEVCKRAAKMQPSERLMNYLGTGDGTYLGVGCNWDLLTQYGMNQRFGGL